MTFAHKPARHLAVLRALPPHCAMLPALALIVACSAGVPTGVDTGNNPADAPIVVNPRSLVLEANQVSIFKAYATGVPGDSLVTSIEWTATGGNISLNGSYSSPTTGEFKIVGKRHGPTKTTSDTAIVAVVPTQPSLTAVVISPDSASVMAGQQQIFSAIGMVDTTAVAIGVTWTATGGTIDAGGVYTAGSTAGTYRVIAVAASANVADTVPVTVTAPSVGGGTHPHQPSGFTQLTSRSWSSLNENGWQDLYSGTSSSSNYFLTTMANASGAQSSVGDFRFPQGQVFDGISPGDAVAPLCSSLCRYMYLDMYFQFSANYIGMPIENKFIIFKTNPSQSPNMLFVFVGDGTSTGPVHPSFELQGTNFPQFQTNTGFNISRGVWHRLEILADGGTGAIDGAVTAWIDGTQVLSRGAIQWTSTNDHNWYVAHAPDPVWGGRTTTPFPATFHIWVDDSYISSKSF